MVGMDKPTGRVVALIVLLVAAGAALRGYLPVGGRVAHPPASESPVALVILVVVLGVSLVIVTVALINRVRSRQAMPGTIGALAVGSGGRGERPGWRVLLIGLVVLAVWLSASWLLTRMVGWSRIGGSARPPAGADTTPPAVDGTPRTQPSPAQHAGDVFGFLAGTTVTMLALIIVGVVAANRIRAGVTPPAGNRGAAGHAATGAGTQSWASAAELGLVEIGDLRREPREAIIACYATMERQLGRIPDAVPQDFDTATEVLARAVEHHALPADNAVRLVDLFTEARFSPHPMTERQRDDAQRILRLVLDELRGAA